MLHMNAYGGDGLRACLPEDLYELYLETSRRTPDRRQSIVLDNRLGELSVQPHLGPPNEGPRPHTGVHRRTLRQILLARLGDSLHLSKPAVGYEETDSARAAATRGRHQRRRRCAGRRRRHPLSVRGQRLPESA